MCLHIESIDMISYQTAKCSFTFYRRYSFTPDKFRNIFYAVVLSDGRHSYIHKYESNVSMLSRGNFFFYLKSVKFLFLFSIDIEAKIGCLNHTGTHNIRD